MLEEEFLRYVNQGYTHIPLTKKIEIGNLNPIEIYSEFYDRPNSYLFESLEENKDWSRYTIIGLPSNDYITVKDDVIKVIDIEVKKNGTVENIENDVHKFEFLNKKGAKIYDGFEQAHCAKNWNNLRESRKTVAAINVGLEKELRFDKVLDGMVKDDQAK